MNKIFIAILASSILILGFLLLWIFYPTILQIYGGFNILSSGVVLLLVSLPILFFYYLFQHAQGRPLGRWGLNIILTYTLLIILISLGFLYNLILPSSIPTVWRYFILPLATLVLILHLLRKIPKIREKLDKLAEELGW